MKKCPCKECVLLAMCKYKSYRKLFMECSILLEYEPNFNKTFSRNNQHIKDLYAALNPTRWSIWDGPKTQRVYVAKYDET